MLGSSYEKITYTMHAKILLSRTVAAIGRGKAMELLDSGYWEFIDILDRLGELGSTAGMINQLSHYEDDSLNRTGLLNQLRNNPLSFRESKTSIMIYEFWKNGWIDACEVKSKCKNKDAKRYRLKICLKEISGYFAQKAPDAAVLASDFHHNRIAEISA